MARKKNPKKSNKNKHLNKSNPAEKKSRRSLGSYYIKKNASGSWSLILETYEGGKRFQETVEKALYGKFNLQETMTIGQARDQIKIVNAKAKEANEELRRQRNALKRVDRLVGISKRFFPPELVKKFREKIYGTHTTHRYKVRMDGVFSLVQEMISKEIKIQPNEYADEIDKITAYFIKKQFSVSYCGDIIYILNKWGKLYAKQTGTVPLFC